MDPRIARLLASRSEVKALTMAESLTRQQFASALSDLDDSFDRDREQDLQVQAIRLRLEGSARRLREALTGGDRHRVDVEASYIAALSDELRKIEDLDQARHSSDHQLWWRVRPFITFKDAVTATS